MNRQQASVNRKEVSMVILTWVKCKHDVWCSFEGVNLTNVVTEGVYIIWHAGNPGRVVRVGQGDIAERLQAYRTDDEILAYKQRGKLCVTWASVPVYQQDGVERHLADTWNPLVGARYPDALPIAVNSPLA